MKGIKLVQQEIFLLTFVAKWKLHFEQPKMFHLTFFLSFFQSTTDNKKNN